VRPIVPLRESRLALLLKLGGRNIFRQKLRTAVTLGAVAFGVAAIVVSGGFVQDMFIQLAEAIIHSQSGHLQVTKRGFFSQGSQSPEHYLIPDPKSEKEFLATLPSVADSMARVNFSGLLNNRKADLPIVGEGIEPAKEAALGSYMILREGRPLAETDRYGILLGQGVAHALNLRPGDSTTLLVSTAQGAMNTLDVEVVGVFQSFSQEYDNRAIKITLAAAQELLATPGVNTLVVALHRTSDTGPVRRVLEKHAEAADLEVRTWKELNEFYQGAIAFYEREFGVLRLIILVMVLLGVVNATNMSAFERVGEFGTMQAVGNRRRDIFILIVIEGTLIGLLGALLGTVIGILLAEGISYVGIAMPPPPNSNLPYTAQIRVVPFVIVSAFFIGLGGAVLASILPAFRVSRIPLATALRENV
jgi:putative ABC transport system permease protein